MDLKQHIRHVPDFPKAGILFYDITTLLRNPEGFSVTIDLIVGALCERRAIELVVGIESRGFILGAPSPSGSAPGSSRFASRASCRPRAEGDLRAGIRHRCAGDP